MTYSDNFRPKQIYGTFLYSLIDITVASCNKMVEYKKRAGGVLFCTTYVSKVIQMLFSHQQLQAIAEKKKERKEKEDLFFLSSSSVCLSVVTFFRPQVKLCRLV